MLVGGCEATEVEWVHGRKRRSRGGGGGGGRGGGRRGGRKGLRRRWGNNRRKRWRRIYYRCASIGDNSIERPGEEDAKRKHLTKTMLKIERQDKGREKEGK